MYGVGLRPVSLGSRGFNMFKPRNLNCRCFRVPDDDMVLKEGPKCYFEPPCQTPHLIEQGRLSRASKLLEAKWTQQIVWAEPIGGGDHSQTLFVWKVQA